MVSRIVIISDQIVARGGAEAMAVASAKLFCGVGISVTFFTGDDGNSPELRDLDVEIIAVGGTHVLKASKIAAFKNGLYFAASRDVLKNWIDEHDNEQVVYHVHSWSKILSPAIFAALKPVQNRTIIHAHDFFMICPNGGFMNYQKEQTCDLTPMSVACLRSNCDKRSYAEKLWRVGRQKILNSYFDVKSSSSKYLLVHRGMAPFFLRNGVPENQISVVRNPVDFPMEDRVRAEENHVVCFIGRLDPEKGVQDAAKAARAAGVTLRVMGDGVQRELLRTEFPEVIVEGWCSALEINAHLLTARLLVVPSRWRETFGMVVVEALRLGIPVVISDKALIAEDLINYGAGLAIDTQNIPLFTDVLRRLATGDAEIRAMSEKAMHAASCLAMTSAEWRDTLLSHYQSVLSTSEAVI